MPRPTLIIFRRRRAETTLDGYREIVMNPHTKITNQPKKKSGTHHGFKRKQIRSLRHYSNLLCATCWRVSMGLSANEKTERKEGDVS